MLLPKSQSLAGFKCSVDASGSRVQLILWSLWSLNTTNFHFHFGRKEQYQLIPKIAGLSEMFSLTPPYAILVNAVKYVLASVKFT